MKCLLIFCVAIIGAVAHHLPESEKQKLKEVHDSCQVNPATHVDENLIKKLEENVEDKAVGDHLFCTAVKLGLLTSDGDLKRDVIKSKIAMVTHDESKVDGLVKKCAIKYETPEKTAVFLFACFKHNDIHYGPEI